MDLTILRSVIDFIICLILLIVILLTTKYYLETKIPDYFVFSLFFLAINLNSFLVALAPFLPLQSPSFDLNMFNYLKTITWEDTWIILLIHNILFFNLTYRKKIVTLIGFIAFNVVQTYIFFFQLSLFYSINGYIPYSISILTITFLNYLFNARISEIDFATTKKVRNLWLIAIFIALITTVIQLLGSIFMPENFINYYLADLFFLIAIFVIFFISYSYPQSFLLSKNHVLRALKLYNWSEELDSNEKNLENTKSEQIKDYLSSIRQYITLDAK